MPDAGDLAGDGRNLVLELAGIAAVGVELAPSGAFRKPDELIGRRQITEVISSLPRFIISLDFFFVDVADAQVAASAMRTFSWL
jgi:hypothetical protein